MTLIPRPAPDTRLSTSKWGIPVTDRVNSIQRYRFDMSNPAHQDEFLPQLLAYISGEQTQVGVTSIVAPGESYPGPNYQAECLQIHVPQLVTTPGAVTQNSIIMLALGLDPARFGAEPGDVVEISTFISCATALHGEVGGPYELTPMLDERKLETNNITAAGAFGAFDMPQVSIPQWSYYISGYLWAGTSYGYPTYLSNTIHITSDMAGGGSFWNGFGVGVWLGPIWANNDFTMQIFHTDLTVYKRPGFTTIPPPAPTGTALPATPDRSLNPEPE